MSDRHIALHTPPSRTPVVPLKNYTPLQLLWVYPPIFFCCFRKPKMPTPPLLFSRKWKNEVHKLKVPFHAFRWMSRENVVMHVSTKRTPGVMPIRAAIGHFNSNPSHNRLPIKVYSDADVDSPFSHLRFNTLRNGKILRFEKNGNLIRGKRIATLLGVDKCP